MASYYVVKKSNASAISSPILTSAPAKPYVEVKQHGYIPLTSESVSLPGTKIKVSNSTYRFVEAVIEEYATTVETVTTTSSTYTLSSTTWDWAKQGENSGTNGRECGVACNILLYSYSGVTQTGPNSWKCGLHASLTMQWIVTQGVWYVGTPIWIGAVSKSGNLASYWAEGGPATSTASWLWTDDDFIEYTDSSDSFSAAVGVNPVALTASIAGAFENPIGASGGSIQVGYEGNVQNVNLSTRAYRTSAPYAQAGGGAPVFVPYGVSYMAAMDVGGGRSWSGTTSSMYTYTQPVTLTDTYETTTIVNTTLTRTVTR